MVIFFFKIIALLPPWSLYCFHWNYMNGSFNMVHLMNCLKLFFVLCCLKDLMDRPLQYLMLYILMLLNQTIGTRVVNSRLLITKDGLNRAKCLINLINFNFLLVWINFRNYILILKKVLLVLRLVIINHQLNINWIELILFYLI